MAARVHRESSDGAEAPEAAYQSEKQFQRLLDMLPAGAYMCDPDGMITYFNERAVQIWGRMPALCDPVDRFCGSFKLFTIDGSPLDHDACWMALALKNQAAYNGHEIIIERPDGERLIVLAHANPLHDDAGGLLGAVNVLVDITRQKRTEQALVEADRAKDEFLATLAHELRNPLAPIRNALHILDRKGTAEPEAQRAVAIIDRQMQQMRRLVDDLLDIGRISGNKLNLREDRVELSEIVQTAVEVSQSLIEEGEHDLKVLLPPQPVTFDGDGVRLAQVLSNLLNNAATYTPRGGLIELEAVCRDGEVAIMVRDDGIGIPSEMLPHIFGIFTQAERLPDRPEVGLGVGLALAQRVVELHDGTITAASDGLGAGATFTVHLPLGTSASNEETAEVQVQEADRMETPSVPRILVVDDNADVAESMLMLLELMDVDARTAHDGSTALEAAAAYRPDIILLDIGLPGMSGHEVARALRREPWGEDVTLIAVTGWGQKADMQRSEEAGFDHHLVKPVDPDELLQLLASAKRNASPQNSD